MRARSAADLRLPTREPEWARVGDSMLMTGDGGMGASEVGEESVNMEDT
jgi:hypothetical protein